MYVPSKSLELPEGFQGFSGLNAINPNEYGATVNTGNRLKRILSAPVSLYSTCSRITK